MMWLLSISKRRNSQNEHKRFNQGFYKLSGQEEGHFNLELGVLIKTILLGFQRSRVLVIAGCQVAPGTIHCYARSPAGS
jgi:hypothetical protein